MANAAKLEPTSLTDIVMRNSGYPPGLPVEIAHCWAVVRGILNLLTEYDKSIDGPEVQAKLKAIGPEDSVPRQKADEYIEWALVEIREAKAA